MQQNLNFKIEVAFTKDVDTNFLKNYPKIKKLHFSH